MNELKNYFPEKGKYHYGTGRRKTAVAKVRIYNGKGLIKINGLPVAEYFNTESFNQRVAEPLNILELNKKIDVYAEVLGGGKSAQATAVRHGMSRALILLNKEYREALKKAGYLRRDPREKERKKPGLKRARKRPQFAKR